MQSHGKQFNQTASQTAGPYVHIGLMPAQIGLSLGDGDLGTDIAGPHAQGELITVQGHIIDKTGTPIKDGVIEIWQANAQGVFADQDGKERIEKGFRGWGRTMCDFKTGLWQFKTIKPGMTKSADGAEHAPHISLWILARGINKGLNTRLYFEDEQNDTDPVLGLIEWRKRRETLIAKRLADASETTYQFDVILQGSQETVFFDV